MARIIFAFEGLSNYDPAHETAVLKVSILNFLRLAGVMVNGERIVAPGAGGSGLSAARDYVLYFDWPMLQRAVEAFAELELGNMLADGRYNTFVATGHSLGGGTAWDFAHAVGKKYGLRINLGFTIEPRNSNDVVSGNDNAMSPWRHNGQTFPQARRWMNYHQKTKGWSGYALPGLAPGDDQLVTPEDYLACSHDALLSYFLSDTAQVPAVSAMYDGLAAVGFFQNALPPA
ncbi:MAG TPA: hypothetical protein VGN88_10985 [Phycisphaerae bacterium]|jgi:hypothetical protein